jgi:hypothetical protein
MVDLSNRWVYYFHKEIMRRHIVETRKIINIMIIVLCLCLIAGIGTFIYNAKNDYGINRNFVSLPLQFNPDDSSSSYKMSDAQITVYGGFVKGIQKGKDGAESLVVRALSPLPSLTVVSGSKEISLLVENVNPDFYAKSIAEGGLSMSKEAANSLKINIPAKAGEEIKIKPEIPAADSTSEAKYVILGDNRNGYDTFAQIIQQVNGINPVFVIDNGDLVFSGKPNQYRLFDRLVSKFSST